MENTYQSPWACTTRARDPFYLSFSTPMLNTLLAKKHTLVCVVTSLIHCFMMCPTDTIEPLRVRTLIHTVSFRSHTVPCTGRAGPLEVAGDKEEQLDFVKCPHQASHLTITVREERQPTLLAPSLDSPMSLRCWHSHPTPYTYQLALALNSRAEPQLTATQTC